MKKDLMEAINSQGSGTRAKIESEVNRIDEMDKIRNGKISKNSEDIIALEEETKLSRWCERNKKLTALFLLIGMLGVAFAYHSINFKRTVEKILKIELNDINTSDST